MSGAAPAVKRNAAGRGSASAIIAEAQLPDAASGLITTVIRRARLWRRERADVARELVAHFRDGLDAGRPAADLVRDFGDPRNAARLIRRAKRRNRPLWWQTFHRVGLAINGLVIVLVLMYGYTALRYHTGKPTIARNYVAELNAPIVAVPETDRGWSLYLEAFEALSGAPTASHINYSPGGEGWDQQRAFIESHQPALATLRAAASRRSMGMALGPLSERERAVFKLSDHPAPSGSSVLDLPENPALVGVLLPHLGPMRIGARLLANDAQLAASRGDGERVRDNLVAIMGIARHVGEHPLLISGLVGIAIAGVAQDTLLEVMSAHPGVLDDSALGTLAHAIAAWPGDGAPVRFTGERMFWHDMAQRMYTDDGRGGGVLTAEGTRALLILSDLGSSTRTPRAHGALEALAGPAAAMVAPDRRTMTERFDRYYDLMERAAATPLWKRGPELSGHQIDGEVERLRENPLTATRYAPIIMLMPALSRAVESGDKAVQRRDATLAAIAVELHRRRTGALPKTLDELTPGLLPSVPLDRFTGRPLNLAPAANPLGFVLYSVGADLNDDAGRPPAPSTSKLHPRENDPSRWIGPERLAEEQAAGRVPDGDWVLVPRQDP